MSNAELRIDTAGTREKAPETTCVSKRESSTEGEEEEEEEEYRGNGSTTTVTTAATSSANDDKQDDNNSQEDEFGDFDEEFATPIDGDDDDFGDFGDFDDFQSTDLQASDEFPAEDAPLTPTEAEEYVRTGTLPAKGDIFGLIPTLGQSLGCIDAAE